MNFFKLLSSSSAYLGLSYVLRFAITITIAKLLTAEDLGVYSWAITAFGLISIFINFGQDNFLLKKIPEYKALNPNILASVVGYSVKKVLVNCLLILPIVYILLYSLKSSFTVPEYTEALMVLAVALPLTALTLINSSILRTNEKPLLAQLPDSIVQPACLLILIYSFYYLSNFIQLDAIFLVFFNACGWLAAFIFSLIASKFFYLKNKPKFLKSPQSSEWSKDSAIIVLGVLAWSLLGRSDVFFLAFLVEADQVGKYFICMRLAEFSLFFATVSFYIWSGEISNLYQKKDYKEVQHLLKKSSRLCFSTSIIFFTFAIIFSEEILLLINSEYADSVLTFKIALIGFLVLGCAGILGPMFYIVGDIKFLTKIQFIVGLIFLSMMFIFVPYYGIEGCVVCFVFCQLIYILAMAIRLKSKFQFTISPF